jgi:hypothetical protein
MKVQDVKVTKVDANTDNELTDTFYRVCVFCNKLVRVSPHNFKSCIKMSGGNFYCPSCLRNNFHHRSSRNVLIMSYRAIIAYYYHKLYPEKMYCYQIKDCLYKHEKIGLESPVMSYDPESFLWFVDFNRIGDDRWKAPFKEVLVTAKDTLHAFALNFWCGGNVEEETWNKFEKAMTLYYEKRKRPKGRRMLIPTFAGSTIKEKDDFWNTAREFTKRNLNLK